MMQVDPSVAQADAQRDSAWPARGAVRERPAEYQRVQREHVIHRQGKDYALYAGLLDAAHRDGLCAITTVLLEIPSEANHHTAIVFATVETARGTFTGIGDATPQNVNRQVATALIRIAECFPLSTEILTREGWKRHDSLVVGEPVLAYDPAADASRWVPLLAVSTFPAAPLMRLQSESFSVVCTPDHKWPVRLRGTRLRAAQRVLKPAAALRMSDAIVVAAPCAEGDHGLSERDAAILGWLATDGSLRYATVTDRWGTFGPYPRAHIDQSKPRYVAELAALLGDDATARESKGYERRMPSGQVSYCRPSTRFGLRTAYLRRLLGVSGVREWSDLPALVCRLSPAPRAAFLDAALKGDGSRLPNGSWVFGKAAKGGHVMEAVEIAATLEGIALGKVQGMRNRPIAVRSLRKHRHVAVAYLTRTALPDEPVWCPTTPLGTCVARFASGTITVTGQTRAKARALRDAINLAEALADDPQGDADPREPEGPPADPDAGARDAAPDPDADARAYEQALGRWQAASAALDGQGIAHPQPPTGANAATLDKWTARAQEKLAALAALAGGRDGDA